MILEIRLLSLRNANEQFLETERFTYKKYIAATKLAKTKRVKLINQKEFTAVTWDKKAKAFMVYIAALLAMSIIKYKS